MSSEAAKRAVAKYQREQMESISIRVKRSEGLYNRIKQAATVQGVKPAQFIKKALVTALDGPQHVQAAQPQPNITTATAPDNMLQVPLSSNMIYNMDGAIRCGYSSDRVQYAIRAINTQIQQDIATEKQRRARPVYPPDDYYDE